MYEMEYVLPQNTYAIGTSSYFIMFYQLVIPIGNQNKAKLNSVT